MNRLLTILLFSPLIVFGQKADKTLEKNITKVSFGSCSKEHMVENQLWNEVLDTKSDLWIWLGDNIYGDTEDMTVMREKYDLQKSHPDYQKLLKQTDIIGIWDDHDFGVNDGGKEYPAKDGSKEALFEFLDVDENHPARNRLGAHQSYTYEGKEGTIKVILLDTRYFRDELKWLNPGTSRKESIVNPMGDILGEEQWNWFQTQLSDEEIDFFIIGSGIQVIPSQHRWEKWSNFPKSRARLFKLIAEIDVPAILISGDRHLSEVSKINVDNYIHPLYEITSSSLTSGSGIEKEENKYIVKEKIYVTNFASLTINWKGRIPILELKYFGKGGKVLAKHRIEYK